MLKKLINLLKNNTSSEDDKSQDGAIKDSIA